MTDVPVVVLAGQSNADFGGIDNRVVERLTATGNAFEFAKVTLPGASLFASPKEDFDPASGELFTDLVDATKAAMANAIGQGDTPQVTLLFVQGETDGGRPSATYAQKLTEFITDFRSQIGVPDAEVYIALLPKPVPGRTAQLQVAASVPGGFTIETAGLATWDGTHYDHAGRDYIANDFIDQSGIAAPTIEGYHNLLAETSITVADDVVHVQSALYTDLTFVGDDRSTFLDSYSGDDVITTGSGADSIRSGDNDDRVFSGAGNDYVNAAAGDDYVDGGPGNDYITGFIGLDTIYGGAGDDRLFGYTENDYLNGGEGNDTLDGGAGVDTMAGGTGDDTYLVDNSADKVIELPGQGNDTVSAAISFDLAGQAIETLKLTGSGNIDAFGNELANTLIGNGGNNLLDGRGGADAMAGGLGNDVYVVDDPGDVVSEAAGGGTDLVRATVSFTLGANVEGLMLDGTANIAATGNALDNRLIGNSGNNALNGGPGADYMAGGDGLDTYYVDNAGDAVVETQLGVVDLVHSMISYTLGANVERLTLDGTANIIATGNALGNLLTGNSGNNILNGGLGADHMAGGDGLDTYYVDNAGDTVVETQPGVIDLVHSTISYMLGANVERLTLDGVASIDATGNELDNRLIGNSGNNLLNGGLGADYLAGGAGSDQFVFDSVLGSGNSDVIADFATGSDKIALDDAIFTALPSTLDEAAFWIGAAAHDADDRIVYNDLTGALWYDADGSGAGAPIQFATLTGGIALSQTDFLIV